MFNTNISDVGLVISQDRPYLAASPDGLCNEVVLEFKCPYSARDKEITPVNVPYLTEKGLKITHDYYFQIQGQLFCTRKFTCHFCVFTQQDFRVFVIERDEAFIRDMLSKLDAFYATYFQPALLDHFVYHDYDKYFC